MKHLIDMETLTQDGITQILDKAQKFLFTFIKKRKALNTLKGRIISNLFFEPSTRTRNSFTIAGQRLGAIVLNPDMQKSSTVKGETLLDTIHVFEAMGTELFIIRHPNNNTALFVASELNTNASVINAGDGDNQHPTQALLDLLTIRQHKPHFDKLTVTIVGDIVHSRVARSLIQGLRTMKTHNIRLVAPESLVPHDIDNFNVHVFHQLTDGIADADIIVALRIQKERMEKASIPDTKQFFNEYGLKPEILAYAKKDAIVMHPGPMNRGVEIDSSVADGNKSVILQQVQNGVAVRMAIMDALFESK